MASLPQIPPLFVIHVKGETRREQWIRSQLLRNGLEAEFMLAGNKDEITEEVLSRYFFGKMHRVTNATSCAWKHIMVYEKMVRENIPLALVLEDDIELYRNFGTVFPRILSEISIRGLKNVLVSCEESLLIYVKGSEREKNTVLYPAWRGRLTGAYLVDYEAAVSMLAYLQEHKTDQPIDWFHNICAEKNMIRIWWSHPAIACQGSLSGKMGSLIDDKKTGWSRQWSFRLQRFYKRLIYRIR